MEKSIIKLRIALWLILLLAVGWLFYMKIVPMGSIEYAHNFKKNNFFINKLTPSQRVKEPHSNSQKITGDPVYFSVFSPRRFDRAEVAIKYKIKEEIGEKISLIEAGVLADQTVWRYDLKPVYSRILNEPPGWSRTEENGALLLQRQEAKIKKYGSIKEFLSDPPGREQVGLYNFNLDNNFKIDGYQASGRKQKIEVALRGDFQLYTYIKDENLDFEFKIIDINKNKDSDAVDFNLYYRGELIDSRRQEDDGESNDSGRPALPKIFYFKVAGLPEGAYRLEIKAGTDIITEEIVTTQKKIAFINRLWLYGEGGNIALTTNSRVFGAVTANPASLQVIKADGAVLAIDNTHHQFSGELKKEISELIIEKADIILSGDGLFSFKPDEFFNPDYYQLGPGRNFIPDKVNYILAEYDYPETDGEYFLSKAVFDLAGAYREKNKYNFLISIPGLRAEDGIDSHIIVTEIKVNFFGKNIIEYLKKFF